MNLNHKAGESVESRLENHWKRMDAIVSVQERLEDEFYDRLARLEERIKVLEAKEIMCTCPDHEEPHKHNVPPSECEHSGYICFVCEKCGTRLPDLVKPPSDEPKVTMEDVLIEEMRRDECKHPDGFRTSSYAEGKLITTCLKCNTSWDNDGKDYPGQIHIADEPKEMTMSQALPRYFPVWCRLHEKDGNKVMLSTAVKATMDAYNDGLRRAIGKGEEKCSP